MRKWINLFEDEQSFEQKVEKFFNSFVRMNPGDTYTINNGKVDVDGDVILINMTSNDEITIPFGRVSGSFVAHNLTSLINCPDYVGGVFDCDESYLTSLKGLPKYIGDDLYCSDLELTSNDEYRWVLYSTIDGDIKTGIDSVDKTLNTYKNNKAKIPTAILELKSPVEIYNKFGNNNLFKERVQVYFNDYGIDFGKWVGDKLIVQTFRDAKDFAEDYGDKDASYYCGMVVDGDNIEIYEYNESESEIEDLFEKLDNDTKQKIADAIGIDVEDIDSSEIINSEFDSDFKQAVISGMESGATSEMYETVYKELSGQNYLYFFHNNELSPTFLHDCPVVLAVDAQTICNILSDKDKIDTISSESWWELLNDGEKFSISVPYYGFSGYDEHAALEQLDVSLSEKF